MYSRVSVSHDKLNDLRHPKAPLHPSLDPARVALAASALGRCTTEHLLDYLGAPITRANEMIVGQQLRNLGYSKKRVSVSGRLAWVYFPPQP